MQFLYAFVIMTAASTSILITERWSPNVLSNLIRAKYIFVERASVSRKVLVTSMMEVPLVF